MQLGPNYTVTDFTLSLSISSSKYDVVTCNFDNCEIYLDLSNKLKSIMLILGFILGKMKKKSPGGAIVEKC